MDLSGWHPAAAFPTVQGAYFRSAVSAGNSPGTGVAATMAKGVGSAERYFSLWLDTQSPSTTRAGYELRFTGTGGTSVDIKLSKWTGGSQQVLVSKSAYTLPDGSSVALVDEGGNVSAWVSNGGKFQSVLTVADSGFASGNAGIEASGGTVRLTNFKVGQLLTPVKNMDSAVRALPLNDTFERNELEMPSTWKKLSWVKTVGKTENAWRAWNTFPTLEGAYWNEGFVDSGNGVAMTMTSPPAKVGGYFSLWLDMPSPSTVQSGYELRFTETSTNAYTVQLVRWIEGAAVQLSAATGYFFPAGGRFALLKKGNTVSAWTSIGGEYQQLIWASDSTFSGGYTGMSAAGNLSRFNDFRSGVLPPF